MLTITDSLRYVINDVREKEKELGIVDSYHGWTKEMNDYIDSKGYDRTDIINYMAYEHLINKEREIDYATTYDKVPYVFNHIKENTIAIYIPEQIIVYSGNNINMDYCKEHNLTILDMGYDGGTIISAVGDIGIVIKGFDLPEYNIFMDMISDFLGAYIDGNDHILNNKKVQGSSYRGGLYTFHLSFGLEKEIIDNVCIKHSNKEPGSITEMIGKTKEDFIDFLKKNLKITKEIFNSQE